MKCLKMQLHSNENNGSHLTFWNMRWDQFRSAATKTRKKIMSTGNGWQAHTHKKNRAKQRTQRVMQKKGFVPVYLRFTFFTYPQKCNWNYQELRFKKTYLRGSWALMNPGQKDFKHPSRTPWAFWVLLEFLVNS